MNRQVQRGATLGLLALIGLAFAGPAAAETLEVAEPDAPVMLGKDVLARLPLGRAITVIQRRGEWIGLKVQTAEGEKTGWMHVKHTRPIPAAVTPEGGPALPVPASAAAAQAGGGPVAFLRYNGVSPAMSGTALHRIWREPEVQEFLELPLRSLEGYLAAKAEEVGINLWELRPLLEAEILACLQGIDRLGFPSPRLLISVRTGDAASPQRQAVDALLALLKGHLAPELFSVENTGEVVVTSVQLGGTPVQYAFVKERFWVGLGRGVLQAALGDDRAGQPEFPLDQETFGPGAAEGDVLTVYYNHPALLRAVAGLIPPPAQQAMSRLGLDSLQWVAMRVRPQDRAYRTTLAVSLQPGVPHGIFDLLQAGPDVLRQEVLSRVPATSHFFAASSLDAAAFYDRILALAQALEEEELEDFSRSVAEAEAQVGFRIRDELLTSLGREAVVFSLADSGFFTPAVLLLVEVSDAGRFNRCMDSLVRFADAQMKSKPGEDGRAAGMRIMESAYHETAIRVLVFENAPVPLSPAYAVVGQHLVFSFFPHLIKDYILFLEQKGPDIRSNPDFQSARSQLPAETHSLLYGDFRAAAKGLYWLLPMALAALEGVPENPIRFDLGKYPAWASIEPHLTGVSGAGWRVGNVQVIDFYSPTVLPVVMGDMNVATVSILAGIALPALARARGEAQRAVCMNHLRQVGAAYLLHLENQGQGPLSLLDLKDALGEPSVLICPLDKTPLKPEEGLRSSYDTAFERAAGFALPEGMPAHLPLAWDRTAWHDGGRNVCFFDGHVEHIPDEGRFAALMQELDEEIAALGPVKK